MHDTAASDPDAHADPEPAEVLGRERGDAHDTDPAPPSVIEPAPDADLVQCGMAGCSAPGTAYPTLLLWAAQYHGKPSELTFQGLAVCAGCAAKMKVEDLVPEEGRADVERVACANKPTRVDWSRAHLRFDRGGDLDEEGQRQFASHLYQTALSWLQNRRVRQTAANAEAIAVAFVASSVTFVHAYRGDHEKLRRKIDEAIEHAAAMRAKVGS